VSYFLQTFHKNLQRLPSLAFCLSCAPVSRPATIDQVGATYRELMTRLVPVPQVEIERVVRYLADRALLPKYGGTATKAREGLGRNPRMELQHWLLNDSSLGSATGAEKDQSYQQTVNCCIELGLLREQTCTIQSYGKLLLLLAQETGLLGNLGERSSSQPVSFNCQPPYAMAAYLRVLREDYEIQRQLTMWVPEGEFTFTALANNATQVLRNVETRTPPTVANREARDWLKRQLLAATKLESRIKTVGWQTQTRGQAVQTLYRPMENLFLPRLEFLVDCGFLEKPDPGRYVYRRSAAFPVLVQLFEKGLPDAERAFFRTIASAFGKRTTSVGTNDLIDHLRVAYGKFRNIAGYATILESVVYSNLHRWNHDPWPVIELPECIRSLNELAVASSASVRINSDRFRRPFAFRVVEDDQT